MNNICLLAKLVWHSAAETPCDDNLAAAERINAVALYKEDLSSRPIHWLDDGSALLPEYDVRRNGASVRVHTQPLAIADLTCVPLQDNVFVRCWPQLKRCDCAMFKVQTFVHVRRGTLCLHARGIASGGMCPHPNASSGGSRACANSTLAVCYHLLQLEARQGGR